MLLPVLLALTLHQAPLTTIAEQSAWLRTGRYAEVESLCATFPKRYPGKVRCDTFGTTPEGRPLLALVASADGTLTPAAATKKNRPVVLFQGGIHAGEIDGKDAGFWLLRDVLDGKALPGVLKGVTALFVPVFNVDGHERFGLNNRPNQVGPEEMGWRVTGQNLNLNRDDVKADAPEMVALLKLLHTWDPLFYDELRPVLTATLPSGGYLIPPAHAGWVAEKLAAHGLRFQRLGQQVPSAEVEVFRGTEVKFRPTSVEGHQGLSVKGAWKKETQTLPVGTLYVPAAQKYAPLLAHLLEPLGPDSLLAWGFFNNHFEQKEYIEDYVLEPFARELLARDPAVKAQWEETLKDKEFAANPRARMRFFHERHPAYDTRLNLYPIFRTDSAPKGLQPVR